MSQRFSRPIARRLLLVALSFLGPCSAHAQYGGGSAYDYESAELGAIGIQSLPAGVSMSYIDNPKESTSVFGQSYATSSIAPDGFENSVDDFEIVGQAEVIGLAGGPFAASAGFSDSGILGIHNQSSTAQGFDFEAQILSDGQIAAGTGVLSSSGGGTSLRDSLGDVDLSTSQSVNAFNAVYGHESADVQYSGSTIFNVSTYLQSQTSPAGSEYAQLDASFAVTLAPGQSDYIYIKTVGPAGSYTAVPESPGLLVVGFGALISCGFGRKRSQRRCHPLSRNERRRHRTGTSATG